MPGPTLTSPLVSTQWLADYLGSDHLVVLDATVLRYTLPNGGHGNLSGHESYLVGGHIPGALFADLIEDFSDPAGSHPFTRPDSARFAAAVGALGIDNETTVVVYDAVLGQWAARLWWLFRAFGHDRVAVLDGGLTKWTAEGRATDVGHLSVSTARFEAIARPELWAEKSEVEAIVLGEASGALVCGLPAKEFSGEEGTRSRNGHIPGSLSVPAARLIDRGSNALRPVPELRESFAGVLGSERIVAYCAAGIAASLDAFALTLAGHGNVAVYDGSLNEWAADPSALLVTGA